MIKDNKILLAKSGEQDIFLYPQMANRHGLIAGVTGSGKTVTLKVLAESFSSMGVPVFMADVKGDLGSVSKSGEPTDGVEKRVQGMSLENWSYSSFPTRFWDLTGKCGHPVRTTVSDMGPTLLSRLLGLSEAQEGVLNIVFRIADDKGWLLIDLKDLRTMLNYVAEHKDEYMTVYGAVSTQSVGGILRALLQIEDQGGNLFFGEPALEFEDFIKCNEQGNGYINILHSVSIIQTPTIYSFFLLWLLSDLFERLPEIGDCEKPKLVFFFDEAHLLFNDMPSALLERIVQVVKLIRSKGVGVYFISQSPGDIPNAVLAQLNNRIQHALHAYTPTQQKAVNVAAASFRTNPAFNTEEVISQLGIGEALISLLQEDGTPSVVERCKVLPPQSFMGTITEDERQQVINSSDLKGKYDVMGDRWSAYEIILSGETECEAKEEATPVAQQPSVLDKPIAQPVIEVTDITGQTAMQNDIYSDTSEDKWLCTCGTENSSAFCIECGSKKLQPKPEKTETTKSNNSWICGCGQENTNKFCCNCGSKKPEEQNTSNNWKCSNCGTENAGNFCINCGNYRPQEDITWKCSCGVENAGNFCYNCGTKKGGQPVQRSNGAVNQPQQQGYAQTNYTQQKPMQRMAPSLNVSYEKQTTTNYTEQFLQQQNQNRQQNNMVNPQSKSKVNYYRSNSSAPQGSVATAFKKAENKISRGLFGSKK